MVIKKPEAETGICSHDVSAFLVVLALFFFVFNLFLHALIIVIYVVCRSKAH